MPICYLHVGTPKTGSSAIQAFLRDQRDVLLKHGLLFPRAGMGSGGAHHPLVHRLYGMPAQPNHASAVSELEAELGQHPSCDVLISSEGLDNFLMPGERSTIVDFFRSRGYELRLICVVRPQPDRLNGGYVQRIKRFIANDDVEDFMQRAFRRGKLAYTRWLTIAQEQGAAFTAVPYNTAVREQGVVAAFLRVLDLHELAPPGSAYRMNPGVGTSAVAAARACMQRLSAQDLRLTRLQQARCAQALRDADASSPSPLFFGLKPDVVSEVEARFAEDNEHFSTRVWGRSWQEIFGGARPRAYNEIAPGDRLSPHFAAYEAIFEQVWPKVLRVARDARLAAPEPLA